MGGHGRPQKVLARHRSPKPPHIRASSRASRTRTPRLRAGGDDWWGRASLLLRGASSLSPKPCFLGGDVQRPSEVDDGSGGGRREWDAQTRTPHRRPDRQTGVFGLQHRPLRVGLKGGTHRFRSESRRRSRHIREPPQHHCVHLLPFLILFPVPSHQEGGRLERSSSSPLRPLLRAQGC